MKLTLLSSAFLIFLFFGCSSTPDSKIIGTWSPLQGRLIPKGSPIWQNKIEKKSDGNYRLIFLQFNFADTIPLIYQKDTKLFTGKIRSSDRKVEYIEAKDHLLISSLTGESNILPVEFERLK